MKSINCIFIQVVPLSMYDKMMMDNILTTLYIFWLRTVNSEQYNTKSNCCKLNPRRLTVGRQPNKQVSCGRLRVAHVTFETLKLYRCVRSCVSARASTRAPAVARRAHRSLCGRSVRSVQCVTDAGAERTPISKSERVRVFPQSVPSPPSILEATPPKWRCFIFGLRVSECLSARVCDINSKARRCVAQPATEREVNECDAYRV